MNPDRHRFDPGKAQAGDIPGFEPLGTAPGTAARREVIHHPLRIEDRQRAAYPSQVLDVLGRLSTFALGLHPAPDRLSAKVMQIGGHLRRDGGQPPGELLEPVVLLGLREAHHSERRISAHIGEGAGGLRVSRHVGRAWASTVVRSPSGETFGVLRLAFGCPYSLRPF